MGIHSGPVNEVADLNEQMNVAGAGKELRAITGEAYAGGCEKGGHAHGFTHRRQSLLHTQTNKKAHHQDREKRRQSSLQRCFPARRGQRRLSPSIHRANVTAITANIAGQ
jgi:hypothetical protein